ncbi:MAG TPA: hypothetical protein VGQ29_15940 [Gemmatimonadales bacterium]|jgi:hypothetical protein|nr:hypothetical protein [Gemmatimonadales bacterium]
MRATPFALAFGEIASRFPAIAEALRQDGAAATDRDRFVLLEPVGRLLREIVPPEAGPDALEAHALLLHHAYQFWAAEQRVYPISELALRRAVAERSITTALPHAALYLQLPELRVWGAPNDASPPEPLDGMFVSATPAPGAIAVLAIFGMRPDRPGFSAVGLEGRADPDDPTASEIEIAAVRDDGSAAFGPTLAGGTAAGLYSVASAGELLLLTSRLLTLLDSA